VAEQAGEALRRAKIVATLGPATDDLEVLTQMMRAGLDVVRLNASHGTVADRRRRLAQVREARKPGSRYAKIEQCRHELALADKLFRRENLPVENTTHTSIEEIASKILARLGIERHMF